MVNEKVLTKLLSFSGADYTFSNFDALTNPETAENAAKGICKALLLTQNPKGSLLKTKLRQSIIQLTQEICSKNRSGDVLRCTNESRANIIAKHLCLNKIKDENHHRGRKKKKLTELFEMLNLVGIQNFGLSSDSCSNQKLAIENVDLGASLININSKHSKSAVSSIVRACLSNLSTDFDDKTYEFLSKVWIHYELIIPAETYDNLTERLAYLIELKLLKISKEMLNVKSEHDLFDTTEALIHKHFPNKHVLFERMSKSTCMFMKIFNILNDIFITTHFETNIQKLIQYILEEVKFRSLDSNQVKLYSLDLRMIAFLLEIKPDELLSNAPDLYWHTKTIMEKLNESNKFSFILLTSHYELWFDHLVSFDL